MLSCRSLSETLVEYRHQPIFAQLYTIGLKHSMLHLDVLLLLYHFARTGEGGILEIGPYLGGSTIAMGLGVQAAGRGVQIRTVEFGGSFKDHPTLPSDDIIKDLRKNLVKRGVDGTVTVLQGMSDNPAIVAEVNRLYAPGSVGLLAIDADGGVARDLKLYGHLLRDDCVLVVDDYYGPADLQKVAPTRVQVDALIARGAVAAFGTYGWGTWIGRRVPGVGLGV